MTEGHPPLWLRGTVLAGLLGGLLLAGFVVLRPFLSAIGLIGRLELAFRVPEPGCPSRLA